MQPRTLEFTGIRVLVAGDLMLDRYWHGDTARISPEAPVPVVRIGTTDERPGGAGNVALNLAALGANVTLVGPVGDDEAGTTLATRLETAGVQCRFVRIRDWNTIVKLRVISQHQQLIRLDFEEPFVSQALSNLTGLYREGLAHCDVVALSDYGKGALREIRSLIELARLAGKPVLVDPKSEDLSVYAGATLLKPNLKEFERMVGRCANDAEIAERGHRLIGEIGVAALLVTRGEHGMTLIRAGTEPLHFPARSREVFDVTGAGDTVTAVLAAAVAAGHDLAEAAALANLAAGIVVSKLGTAVVSAPELQRALYAKHESGSGILTPAQLLHEVRCARARGEKIVMTNGCFDILHAGHVDCLRRARALGDRLIVAVNDDDSVRRLKGAGRPVNTLHNRMTVLAALGCVDWVTPFSDDTPEQLICGVLPDLLVKGGDYRAEDIAGYGCVTQNGGAVRVMNITQGTSTSEIISAIRATNTRRD